MSGDEATFHQKRGPLMNYFGIDYHKKYSQVTAIIATRNLSDRANFLDFFPQRKNR